MKYRGIKNNIFYTSTRGGFSNEKSGWVDTKYDSLTKLL